jgi:aspartate racemase
MKTIGLIGGLSWASTREYYTILNTEYNQRKGKSHSCPIAMYSFDFNEMELLQKENNWISLNEKMADAAMKVERAGASLILICSNTMHYCADFMQERVMIPVLHIADAAGDEMAVQGIKRIGLLGTKYLMNMSFYRERLKKFHAIETLLPDNDDLETINTIIYKELIKDLITDKSRNKLEQISKRLMDQGAEAILLACTELPLLTEGYNGPIRYFNSTRIHALYGLDFAMKEHLYA